MVDPNRASFESDRPKSNVRRIGPRNSFKLGGTHPVVFESSAAVAFAVSFPSALRATSIMNIPTGHWFTASLPIYKRREQVDFELALVPFAIR